MNREPLMIHSHRDEAGALVVVEAGRGDIVRRAGYRRHWVIVGNAGQLVKLAAKNGPGTIHGHASELTMIRKAKP